MQNDNTRSLCQLPSTDGNFISCLNRSSNEEIIKAIEIMKSSDGKHKARIKACERELKKRKKGEWINAL